MKTIAQQLNVKKFPFTINDDNGKQIYFETSSRHWLKREYDSNGKQIYFENNDRYWGKYKYDSNGNQIYFENNEGYWSKREYDSNGKQIYFENSDGIVLDNRLKPIVELTLEEIASKLEIDVKQLRIKE